MKRFTLCCWLALTAVLLALPAGAGAVVDAKAVAAAPVFHVLVLTEGNATAGQFATLNKAANQSNPRFDVDQVKNSANGFTARHLSRYNAVVFLNTTGDALDAEEQAVFEEYFRNGGGFVGIGSAIETNPSWQFLSDILGTRAAAKLDAQTVTNKPADRGHDASKNLPEYWNLNDTYYNWSSNVRGFSHVLTTVSAAPFNKTGDGPTLNALTGSTMGPDHPVSWCKDYQGGRSYYTNHGASAAAWNDANLPKELVGAIRWAAGQSDPVYSDCGATVLANYQQSFVAAPPNLSEPIGFDVLPDGTGRVIQTDRRGGVRLHDPATNATTLLAQIPVYIANEDGMYGPEVDNNFNSNKWVYLYYSPPTVEDVKWADGTLHTQTTPFNDPATPANEQNAPTFAASLSAWDPYVGYFQLSRFKFVDATPTTPRISISRASSRSCACPTTAARAATSPATSTSTRRTTCGWSRVTTRPAGSGNSGGFSPFNGQLTNEVQTVTVSGATGGTFTLTFNGQTTAPIAFPLVNSAIEAALEALSNLTDVAVTGTAGTNRTGQLRGQQGEPGRPAHDRGWHRPHRHARRRWRCDGDAEQRPEHHHPGRGRAVQRTVRRCSAYGAEHQRPARQDPAHQGQGRQHRARREEHVRGGVQRPGRQPLPVGTARTRPEVYAMGFRNPFRITLDKNDVAYITDYSPDSNVPQQFRGPAGTGRYMVVREPSNYGWPLCYKTDLPYYQWDFNTSTPLPSAAAPETARVQQPGPRPPETPRAGSRAVAPRSTPGSSTALRSRTRRSGTRTATTRLRRTGRWARRASRTTGLAHRRTRSAPARSCSRSSTPGASARKATAPYDYDPLNPNPTKFPPYWDGTFIVGEFTQDTLREVRLDSNGDVHKINNTLPCGPVPATPTRPWLCDNPMDMEFGLTAPSTC